MTLFGRVLSALFICVLALAAAGSWARVSASLDRDRAAMGDTLSLVFTATNDEDLGELELSPLMVDFEILQRSSSSKTSYINGQFTSKKELLVEITPRREGSLAIPPLRVGRQMTNTVPVVIGPAPTSSDGDQPLVFEAELDRSSVYVQGQIVLTLRLQQAINLNERNITQLQLDNAFVQPLEQNSFQRTVNGRPWLVHEVRYAIFPEQSGTLEIPAQTFSARETSPRRSVFDIGGSGRQIRRSTEPLSIEVLPRPANYPAAEWLPAEEISLQETWSTPPEQLRVGESATRTITIRGASLQGAQLPPIKFPATQGLKYYPDQPVITDSESPTGLVGKRVDSVAVVPTQAGNWQIPELRIPWWDTRTNELRYAVLPGRELDVAAASPASVAASPTPQIAPRVPLDPATRAYIPLVGGEPNVLWQILAVVNGAGWVLTVIYLVLSRRRQQKPAATSADDSRESPCFKALLDACARGDALQARQRMVAWTCAATSRPGLASLSQVSATFTDPALDVALEVLNASLYSDKRSSWDGSGLATAVRSLRAQLQQAKGKQVQTLQLYPQPG